MKTFNFTAKQNSMLSKLINAFSLIVVYSAVVTIIALQLRSIL